MSDPFNIDDGFIDRYTAFIKHKAEKMDLAVRATTDSQVGGVAGDLTDHVDDRTDVHGITVAAGELVTFNNTLTFSGTDATAITFTTPLTVQGGSVTLVGPGTLTWDANVNIHLTGTTGKILTLTGSLTIGADTTITGGGTFALAGFTLTVAKSGTAVVGTGAANRVAYWNDGNEITSSADFTFTGGTLTLSNNRFLITGTITTSIFTGNASSSAQVSYALGGTNTSSSTAPIGLQFQGTFIPSGGAVTTLFGAIFVPTYNGTVNVTELNAFFGRIDLAALSAGTITQANIFVGNAPIVTAGSTTVITSFVGLRLSNVSFGTNNTYILLGQSASPTGNFGIYSATTNDSYFAGQLGIGAATAPSALLHARLSDAGTNNSPTIAIVDHTSSGTPTTSFGAALDFLLKSSTTVGQDAARLTALWTTATHASRTSALLVSVVGNASALTEVGRFTLDVPLILTQGTAGSEVFRLTTTATNDDPTERAFQNRQATTNNTATTIHTVAIPASTTVGIQVVVVSRRTGGSAGTAEDGAMYVRYATYKNVAGTATLIGAVSSPHTAEDQAGWDVTFNVSGSNVQIQVTGATNNNVTWHVTLRTWAVSS